MLSKYSLLLILLVLLPLNVNGYDVDHDYQLLMEQPAWNKHYDLHYKYI